MVSTPTWIDVILYVHCSSGVQLPYSLVMQKRKTKGNWTQCLFMGKLNRIIIATEWIHNVLCNLSLKWKTLDTYNCKTLYISSLNPLPLSNDHGPEGKTTCAVGSRLYCCLKISKLHLLRAISITWW